MASGQFGLLLGQSTQEARTNETDSEVFGVWSTDVQGLRGLISAKPPFRGSFSGCVLLF